MYILYIYISLYIYIYIYIFIYIYIYIYLYIYIYNVSSRLPQWLCGKSCTWAHDVQLQHCLSCAQVHDLPHCFHDCIYITPALLL